MKWYGINDGEDALYALVVIAGIIGIIWQLCLIASDYFKKGRK